MSKTELPPGEMVGEEDLRQRALQLVSDLKARYQITALQPLLESYRAAVARTDLSVGVLGRFKAGKSSFLNRLVGRAILPVGVVPVTAIVTDLVGGETDSAFVRYLDGTARGIPISEIPQFVSETQNPDNRKGVVSVSVCVPELLRFGGIRLFDTPGLESAFAHNTEAARQWAPNVDVAIVAVAVDPPLSQQDVTLIRNLLEYTPRVAVLLTKFDLLEPPDQTQVLAFVKEQLGKHVQEPVEVLPYSTRSGYEHLVHSFELDFIGHLREQISGARRAVVNRKLKTLVRECGDYMRLSLKAAELLDAEQSQLRGQALGEKNSIEDTKLELRLVARHAAAGCRAAIEKALAPQEKPIREQVRSRLDDSVASFPERLDQMIDYFQAWLESELSKRLTEISHAQRSQFLQPFFDVERQYVKLLQSFRDRLSDRVAAMYGVPLRTTEPEIPIDPPKTPDVNIGRVFDHSWELLSPILPMGLFRRAVVRRLRRKVGDETFKNISRLTAQWEEIVTKAILQLQREAENRIEDLVGTVDRLTSATQAEAPKIRKDLATLDQIAARIEEPGVATF